MLRPLGTRLFELLARERGGAAGGLGVAVDWRPLYRRGFVFPLDADSPSGPTGVAITLRYGFDHHTLDDRVKEHPLLVAIG